MVRSVLFDLDGVLVDACDWHYLSLNRALDEVVGFSISREDHISTYNGLPTKVNFVMLGYFNMIVTNEDVENNKPHPDCYNLAVKKLDISPSDCIIVEDSPKGMQSAKSSIVPDSNIWNVKNTTEVTLENFRRFENENFNTDGG